MTAETTVSDYSDALRRELACFARGRELAVEVRAHLDESIARLEADGLARDEAVGVAIERLGRPREIASAFLDEGEPVAVPTRWTRLTGWLALIAIPAGIAATAFMAASAQAEKTRDWEGLPQALYGVAAVFLVIASVAIVFGALGLSRRLGGLGTAGKVGIGLLIVAAVLSLPGAWLPPAWLVPMTAGLLAVALSLRVRQSSFARPALVTAVASAVTIGAWLVAAAVFGESLGTVSAAIPMLVPAVTFGLLAATLAREPRVPLPALG